MLLESLRQMTLRWLRIPPGTSVRKAEGTEVNSDYINSDYINSMVDITVDDICVGEEPVSVDYRSDTPAKVASALDSFRDEFNTIIKWAAKDLCISGVSVYEASVIDKKLILLPKVEDLEFYLTKDKKVVVYESGKDENLTDLLIFINYSKNSLIKIEDKKRSDKLIFQIIPEPMQLKNAKQAISALNMSEQALLRYRTQLSRIARWVNVDIGVSQGEVQDQVVDSISSAINADSISLSAAGEITEFNDAIPVIPNRRGVGKPELESNIPEHNLKDMADIDYFLGKLNLVMRFPATYMDFSKELGQTAVSLIRSDLRYSKLCSSVRSKLTTTINDFVQESKFKKYEPVFSLTQLPTSEDDDVVQALDNYIDIAIKAEEFLNNAETSVATKSHRLRILQDLFASSTNSPTLQNWYNDYIELFKKLSDNNVEELETPNNFEYLEEFEEPGVDEEFEEPGVDETESVE